MVEDRVLKEIKDGVQTLQHQIVTMNSSNGQSPFVTAFMYLGEVKDEQTKHDLALIIEEMLKQRIQGLPNEQGVQISPTFPKIVYVLEEDNIKEDGKYFYLTQLAAKCSAKRLVPDYVSEKKMKQLKDGDVYSPMGCRSFLTVDPVNHKYWGRFNQGVVTINLVHASLSSKGDINEFWKILDERLELCHKALRQRYERLKGTVSDVAPILWQHGIIARKKQGEVIDDLLINNYSTISLGYAGLYETVKYLTGLSHINEAAKSLSYKIMKRLNDKCEQWKREENIAYSVYGTPLEATTYKFTKANRRDFGEIPDVTNHDYITNSYHVNVREPINAFDKILEESVFQELSPGGMISYIEIPNMNDNILAVITILKYIYENIMYAELNTKSDYCSNCGYDGEILSRFDEETNSWEWYCPHCGCEDKNKLSVIRRSCGYLGSNFWNTGRTSEIHDRVLHL